MAVYVLFDVAHTTVADFYSVPVEPIECPIPKNCLTESIVCQATVSTSDKRPPETYVGLTENKFKLRYANHKTFYTHLVCLYIKEFSIYMSYKPKKSK